MFFQAIARLYNSLNYQPDFFHEQSFFQLRVGGRNGTSIIQIIT